MGCGGVKNCYADDNQCSSHTSEPVPGNALRSQYPTHTPVQQRPIHVLRRVPIVPERDVAESVVWIPVP